MKTLTEINELIRLHVTEGLKEAQTIPKDTHWSDVDAVKKRQASRYKKELDRLLLAKSYLERVESNMILQSYTNLKEKVDKAESSWDAYASTLGSLKFIEKRRKEYEKETSLPVLKKQLKELSWIVN